MKAADYLPVAAFLAVAVHQFAATIYGDLTPWLGGGFGMFSTLDSPGNRAASVYVVDPTMRRETLVPDTLADATERTLAFPTEARVRALATALVASARSTDAEALELTIWRIRPTPEPIRTVRVDIKP